VLLSLSTIAFVYTRTAWIVQLPKSPKRHVVRETHENATGASLELRSSIEIRRLIPLKNDYRPGCLNLMPLGSILERTGAEDGRREVGDNEDQGAGMRACHAWDVGRVGAGRFTSTGTRTCALCTRWQHPTNAAAGLPSIEPVVFCTMHTGDTPIGMTLPGEDRVCR
jgi:hypothetical protein